MQNDQKQAIPANLPEETVKEFDSILANELEAGGQSTVPPEIAVDDNRKPIETRNDNSPVQQSHDDIRVEITTVTESEDYYVQIQGSDRPYPAIVIRRKHRGEGATVTTVSKRYNSGKPNPAYANYEEAIKTYLYNRQKRLNRKRESIGSNDEGIVVSSSKEWLREAVQSVVER